jgi:hypothetical protein
MLQNETVGIVKKRPKQMIAGGWKFGSMDDSHADVGDYQSSNSS